MIIEKEEIIETLRLVRIESRTQSVEKRLWCCSVTGDCTPHRTIRFGTHPVLKLKDTGQQVFGVFLLFALVGEWNTEQSCCTRSWSDPPGPSLVLPKDTSSERRLVDDLLYHLIHGCSNDTHSAGGTGTVMRSFIILKSFVSCVHMDAHTHYKHKPA